MEFGTNPNKFKLKSNQIPYNVGKNTPMPKPLKMKNTKHDSTI